LASIQNSFRVYRNSLALISLLKTLNTSAPNDNGLRPYATTNYSNLSHAVLSYNFKASSIESLSDDQAYLAVLGSSGIPIMSLIFWNTGKWSLWSTVIYELSSCFLNTLDVNKFFAIIILGNVSSYGKI
jgi:hypothetical protein